MPYVGACRGPGVCGPGQDLMELEAAWWVGGLWKLLFSRHVAGQPAKRILPVTPALPSF